MALSGFLREDTAVTIVIGPFVSDTTPGTEEAGLTITASEIFLSKNGGAFAAKNESTAAAAMTNATGSYSCLLNTTDTNTAGILRIQVTETGTLVWWAQYMIIPTQVYDSLFLATDALQVHANEITAGLITATAIATDAIDADAIADNAINAASIAADAITAAKIADGAIDANTFAAGAITAAAIATGAIDADALATDAVNEIQSGLSTLGMATALPGSPTADTVGEALKNASVGIPQSAAGASGGLATYDDLNAGVIFGTVVDTTPAAGNFTGDSGLEDTTDDYYTGRFLIFTSNDLGARKISSYTATSRTFEFLGSTGTDADAPFDAAPVNGSSFIIFGFHGA